MDYQRQEYKVVLHGLPNDFDITMQAKDIAEAIEEELINKGVSAPNIIVRTGAISAETYLSDLDNANIFISIAHGCYVVDEDNMWNSNGLLATGVSLEERRDTPDPTMVYSHAVDNEYYLSTIEEAYKNIDIAVFAGCYTGCSGEGGNNLPSKVVDRGAQAAIGFSDEIYAVYLYPWLLEFVEQIFVGNSVSAAAIAAKNEVLSYKNSNGKTEPTAAYEAPVICGVEDFHLNLSYIV